MSFQLAVSCTALRMLAMAHLLFTISSCSDRLLAYSLPFSISSAFQFFLADSTSFLRRYSWIFISMSPHSPPCLPLLLSNRSLSSLSSASSFRRAVTSWLRSCSPSFFISVIFRSSSSFFSSCFSSCSALFLQSVLLSSLMSLRVAILKFLLSSLISYILLCSYYSQNQYSSLLFTSLVYRLLTLFCSSVFSLSREQILALRSLIISSLLRSDCQQNSLSFEDYRVSFYRLYILSLRVLTSCSLPVAMCLLLYCSVRADLRYFQTQDWQVRIYSRS